MRPRALVTGAAKRVGRATATALARSHCDLLLTYRTSEDEIESTAAELRSHGVEVSTAALDLDDLESVEAFAAAVRAPLDVLVHNASIYFPTKLEEVTAETALRLYRVNALAPLLLSSRLAGLLRESSLAGGGAIVCMVDIHAMGRPRKAFAPYSMSKAALAEMIRSLSRDLAPHIRVNGVAPGVVAFPEQGYESDSETQRRYLSRVPLERSGTPEDAAEVVRWLALDASYTTGQVVRVDGGRWLA